MIAALIDPFALTLVVGGGLMLAALPSGLATTRRALSLADLRRHEEAEEEAAERLIHAASAAVAHRGLFAAETLAPRHHFLRAVLVEVADAHDSTTLARAIGRIEADVARGDSAAVRFWTLVADAAPALGMIGTVAGMIRMAATDPGASVGSGLALALTSTLYGLILSACVAAPIAERLSRTADAAAQWRARFAASLDELYRRESAVLRAVA